MGENRDADAPIRVLLADDHTMFRQGLAEVLARYGAMEVVAAVPNDADALRLARGLRPDVVVMQVQMPHERARQTLEAMRAFEDPPRVVIVTMLESPRHVRALVGAKANAYLLKSDSSEHLIATVRAAVLDPGAADAVVGMPPSMLEGARQGEDSVLTARELEVLLLAARGLSNGRIASSLYLAEGTVKRHLTNVYEKMGVRSRGDAAREALLRDWITIEEIREEEEAEGAWTG